MSAPAHLAEAARAGQRPFSECLRVAAPFDARSMHREPLAEHALDPRRGQHERSEHDDPADDQQRPDGSLVEHRGGKSGAP